MTLKNLSFKLVRSEVSRNLWALALSILGFLLAAPLPMIIRAQDQLAEIGYWEITEETARSTIAAELPKMLTGESNMMPRLGLMIMAALCGIVLFRFLHDRRQVDFYCSLPVRRSGLYATKFTAGLLLVLPAYFVVELLAAVVAVCYGAKIPWGPFLQCIGIDLLAFFTVYGISILCAVVCGNTMFSFMLNGWAHCSVMVAVEVYDIFARQYYPAYSSQNLYDSTVYCPVIGFLRTDESIVGRFLPGYVLIGAAALALSVVLFCRRASERAGTAVAFRQLQLPLKIYTCIVLGMGSACMIDDIIGPTSNLWLLLFVAIAVAACHCITEAAYDADIRSGFRHPGMLLAVTAASLALTFGLQQDVFGYSAWLPKTERVEWVGLYDLTAIEESSGARTEAQRQQFGQKITDPEVVQAVLQLSRMGTENLDLLASQALTWRETEEVAERRKQVDRYYHLIIGYGLRGERMTERQYCIPIDGESEGLINTILYSRDYLFGYNNAFRFTEYLKENPDRKPMAVLEDALRGDLSTLRDPAQMEKLIAALQADVLDFTPAQAAEEGQIGWIRLSTYDPDNMDKAGREYGYRVSIYPSYHRTLELLQAYVKYEPAPLRAEEISSLTVWDGRVREGSEEYDEWVQYTTNHQEEIAALIDNLVTREDCDRFGIRISSRVRVSLVLENGKYIEMSYPVDHVPEEMLTKIFGSNLVQEEGAAAGVYPAAACTVSG